MSEDGMIEWKGFFVEGIEEWSQLLGGCNWYTFHPVLIEFEDDRCMGAIECTFVLLGLGFRARWTYQETEKMQEIKRRIEDIEAGRAIVTPIDLDRPPSPPPPLSKPGDG